MKKLLLLLLLLASATRAIAVTTGDQTVLGALDAGKATSARLATGNGVPASTACDNVFAITTGTAATPIVITTASAHGYSNGMVVTVYGVAGLTGANGTWVVGNVAATTFELCGNWDGATCQDKAVGGGSYSAGSDFVSSEVGRVYFRNDATAGQNIYLCADSAGTPTWTQVTGGGGGSGDITDVGDCSTGACFSAAGTGNNLIFEGPTADTFEMTLVSAEITGSDKTITLPNTTGTVCLDTGGGCASGSGDVTDVGDCTGPLCFTSTGTGNSLFFEGSTVDGFETTLTAVDPTTPDKTISLPNASGTVAVSATSPVTLSALGDVGLSVLTDAQVSDTLTSSLFVGSGSTTTAIDLATAEAAGTLPVARGGTNLTASADDNVMVGNGTTWETKALTTCTGAGKAVTYDAATNTWGCNTISGGGSVTVEEVDAAPSVGSVTTLQFDQVDGFTVTDNTGGSVRVDLVNAPDAAVSDTLTASLFVGSGSTTTAIDLATAEVAGVLPAASIDDGGVAATQALFSGAGSAAGFRAIADADVPNTITIDLATLATTATTANAGDSATAFFSSGTLEVARGGTNLTASADDNVMVGNGTTWETKAVPNCTDTGGNHLNYTTATNAFSCGTSSSGGGGGAATALATTGADVTINTADPPRKGQALRATTSTAATWQYFQPYNTWSGRRVGWSAPLSDTSSALTAVGHATWGVTGTPAARAALTGATRMYVEWPSGTASGDSAGLTGAVGSRAEWRPVFGVQFITDTAITNRRLWFVMTEQFIPSLAHTTGTAGSAIDYVGVGFDTSVSANWLCCSGDGTNHGCTSMGLAVAASTEYLVVVDYSVASEVTCWVNGTSLTKTSNISAQTGVTWGARATVTTLTAASRNIQIASTFLEQN